MAKSKQFQAGTDSLGAYVTGYAAVWRHCGDDVALVCPDMATLRRVWKRISPDRKLDESLVQRVREHDENRISEPPL